jgi:hypothetical protein
MLCLSVAVGGHGCLTPNVLKGVLLPEGDEKLGSWLNYFFSELQKIETKYHVACEVKVMDRRKAGFIAASGPKPPHKAIFELDTWCREKHGNFYNL